MQNRPQTWTKVELIDLSWDTREPNEEIEEIEFMFSTLSALVCGRFLRQESVGTKSDTFLVHRIGTARDKDRRSRSPIGLRPAGVQGVRGGTGESAAAGVVDPAAVCAGPAGDAGPGTGDSESAGG